MFRDLYQGVHMKLVMKLAMASCLSAGGFALVGCDDTVAKHEETTQRADGSKTETSSETKVKSDGTVVKEEKKEVTPATNPSNRP
jgi:hypothetical protein